ncbi:chromosome condensation (RCC1) repeat [Rhizoctonia solani]|uniref:Chromosome condensation (RCC1) repeat n=1 Tax=Rhizoctonia solani TaxID=456999 RepID=A0A8H7IJL0_9AGAM|nr:chromosome condensation (RCC1) repeat [Rhizoctonia solani]
MSNLHAYFHLRNLGAFRQLLDARGVSANRLPDGKSGSGPRSWSQTQVQMTALAQGGQLDHNPNMRDPLGRTVLHLACADLAPIALECGEWLDSLAPALYAGNLPAAVLLSGRSDIDVGIRDLEGMTPFDVYNATVEGTVPESSPSVPRELWVWGVIGRNATLGIGSADDRGYPEAIHPPKPAELLAKLSGSARFKLIGVNDIVMSRLHTSILTDEARANLEACGFGGVGRLGTKQHTQYSFGKVAGLENQTIIRVALGLDHTLALTSGGDVLSWGMNRFHQLGYVIEQTDSPGKPIPKGKANIDSSENQVQVSPKRVVGPLRKEIVVGIAACKTASLGYAKVAPGGKHSSKGRHCIKVVDVALSVRFIETFWLCRGSLVLIGHCYGLPTPDEDLVCFWNGAHFRIQFPQPVFPHRYQPPVNLGRIQISKITCNESAFAALTTAGEVFLFTLPDNPTSETESNPNVRPQKVWALRRRVAAVRDIALGGMVPSSAEYSFRHQYFGVGSALLSGSYRTHKYQRILGLQRVVNVAANPTGGFAALRADATIEPLIIEGKSMAEAIGGIQPYLIESRDVGHSFDLLPALEFGDEDDEEHGGILEDIILAEQLCQAVIRSRKEDGFPRLWNIIFFTEPTFAYLELLEYLRIALWFGLQVLCKVRHAICIGMPRPLRLGSTKLPLFRLGLSHMGPPCPFSDSLILALIKAQPGDIRLDLQRLSLVLQLPQLQFAVESIGKRTPAPTLGPDFARLFHSSQLSERPIVGGDIVSSSRTGLFFDEAEWTQKRWSDDGILVVDMKHFEWKPMDYVFRYMCCGQVDDLFDDIAFAQSVEEFIDFIFQVMSAANELMLEQLTEICSMVILRHVTLVNSVTILADASPFYCPKLKARLHNYIAVNMESLMEKRYLDDVAHDIIKELAKFVRDFPSVVVRTVPPGRQPKLSPKLSPTIGPTSPKTPRRVSSFNLPVTPQRQNTSKQTEKTPQSDGMFVMDEEGDEPVPARDLPTGTETPMVNLPQLPQSQAPQVPHQRYGGDQKPTHRRVDMRSIMADEAASSRPARSPMVRITGFDASNQPPSPSKTLQKDRTQPSSTRQSSQLATPPASASSSWRDPPASSGSPAQRSNEARPRPGEFPSLFEGNLRQRVPSTPTAPPSGPSPSSVPKPNAQQTNSVKSNRPPHSLPSIGTSIPRARSRHCPETGYWRDREFAKTKQRRCLDCPSPCSLSTSRAIRLCILFRNSAAATCTESWIWSRKIEEKPVGDPSGRSRTGKGVTRRRIGTGREAEELAAEIEFMRWWNAEEARVKKEMEGNKGGGGSGGKNRRKGRGGGGKRGKSGQEQPSNAQAAAAGSTARP